MAEPLTVRVESCIRGYHAYKDVWDPQIGNRLETEIDEVNQHDRYAVGVLDNGQDTVGHIPREISKICFYFKKRGGQIIAEVTNRRKRSNVPNKGLEIPCIYEFIPRNQRQLKQLIELIKKQDTETFPLNFV